MDLLDRINALSGQIPRLEGHIETEEATKNALVMPFIQALGYNPFNPLEVVPEFTADVGTKKGEKVDYAIMHDGEPAILFEVKKSKIRLTKDHTSQLFRYFGVTKARIGVLTNGIIYRFFSDLEKPNVMDTKPFLVFDLGNVNETHVSELKKLAPDNFDLDELLSSAADLKYTREIKQYLREEFNEPSSEFVEFLTKRVYAGRLTPSVKKQFTEIATRALKQFINSEINDRLSTALSGDFAIPSSQEIEAEVVDDEAVEVDDALEDIPDIQTTVEELEGFHIIRAILRKNVAASRVAMRDTKSYCGILLDDNNRKPVCRLRFNNLSRKVVGYFDENRVEQKVQINSLSDIYDLADHLISTIERYES